MISDRVQRKLRRTVVAAHRKALRTIAPQASPLPVFVVGSQRSGTTMMMRIFELSAHATVFREGNPAAFGPDLLLREHGHIEQLIAGAGTDVVVFKPMNELQHTPRWLADYPDLRVVWLVRRHEDVVNSCVRKFQSIRETLGQVATDAQAAGWWGEGLSGTSQQLVRDHYRPDMSLADAHALFWVIRNAHYFDLELEQYPQVRLFRYEDLVSNPTERFRDLFEFVGCPFSPRLTREVHPGSVGRNAKPELDEAIATLCHDMQARLDRATVNSESSWDRCSS